MASLSPSSPTLEPDQQFGGGVGRLHRIIKGLAGLIGSRESPWRRSLSPLYGSLLYALSGGRGVAAELNGEFFRVDPRYRWFLQPHYEADLAGFLRARMRPGQCCLDIGAHVGVYALQVARWTAPGGRVIAFEPNPGTAAVLRRHIRMNGLEAVVRIEGTALGRAAGTAALYGDAGSGLTRLSAPNPQDSAASKLGTVDVHTVDDYCAEHHVEPDWMLIDVEGFEFDVVTGATETIRRRGAALSIVVEIHPGLWEPTGWSRTDVDALCRSLGRRILPLTGQRDPLSQYGTVLLEPV
jgi:FkbM family methyltransferase